MLKEFYNCCNVWTFLVDLRESNREGERERERAPEYVYEFNLDCIKGKLCLIPLMFQGKNASISYMAVVTRISIDYRVGLIHTHFKDMRAYSPQIVQHSNEIKTCAMRQQRQR